MLVPTKRLGVRKTLGWLAAALFLWGMAVLFVGLLTGAVHA